MEQRVAHQIDFTTGLAALKQAQFFLELKHPGGGPFDRDTIASAADYAIRQIEQLGITPPERASLIRELEQRHSISIGRESVLQDSVGAGEFVARKGALAWLWDECGYGDAATVESDNA